MKHQASFFLVGVATAVICLQSLLWICIPNPVAFGTSRFFRILLVALSVLGLGLYAWGSYRNYLPQYFQGGIMVSALTMGFLFHPERVKPHDTAELVALAIVMAISCVALDTLDRHRWTDFPAMLAFVYFMLLLAYAPVVLSKMDSRWVKPTIITLSILSFIAVVIALTRCRWMSIYYLLPVWALIVQPVIVYPFIRYLSRNKRI